MCLHSGQCCKRCTLGDSDRVWRRNCCQCCGKPGSSMRKMRASCIPCRQRSWPRLKTGSMEHTTVRGLPMEPFDVFEGCDACSRYFKCPVRPTSTTSSSYSSSSPSDTNKATSRHHPERSHEKRSTLKFEHRTPNRSKQTDDGAGPGHPPRRLWRHRGHRTHV